MENLNKQNKVSELLPVVSFTPEQTNRKLGGCQTSTEKKTLLEAFVTLSKKPQC